MICDETKKIKHEGNWLIGGEFTLFALVNWNLIGGKHIFFLSKFGMKSKVSSNSRLNLGF